MTVVEKPVPPRQRSAPNRTLIVLLSLILGGFLGMGGAFVRAFFESGRKNEVEREKIDEIREHLIPARWRGEKSLA